MTQKFQLILLIFLLFSSYLEGNTENPNFTFLNKDKVETFLFTEFSKVDTLKDPTGSQLSKKQKKRQGRAVQGNDFSLSTTKRNADKLYKALGFMAAADLYENLEGMEKNTFVLAKLANSYRLNGQTEDAEYCYAQIVKDTDDPDHILRYAQMLQSNGKCEDAVRWYKVYLSKSFDTNRDFITDCDQLANFKESDVEVKNLEALNSEHLDFSPVPYNNGIMFTSNRGTGGVSKRRDNWTKENFSDLFYAERTREGEFVKITELNGDINGKYHDGVPTFDRAGKYMIFTRNDKKGKNRNGNKDLKLYEAENIGGFWTNVEELPINDSKYATCHPTMSADGRRLYFASDREGGYGGMDIYYSEKIGRTWSDPINLGPTVNTGGEEIFPFMGEDETLYFASSGHRGLGGLDIFAIRKNKKNDETTWSERENLGRPFNSKKDDFGFVMNKTNDGGYFTSNRIGGFGEDDIYEWKGDINSEMVEKSNMERTICVYDKDTGDRIEGATVSIFETKDGNPVAENPKDFYLTVKPMSESSQDYVLSIVDKKGGQLGRQDYYTTDRTGTFDYTPEQVGEYIFVVEKDGYFDRKKTLKASEILKNDEYCFELENRNCLTLNGLVKNKDYPKFIQNAEVKVFNKCTGELETYFSDNEGKFDACLDCGCDYEVVASKMGFEPDQKDFSTLSFDCLSMEFDAPLSLQLDLKPGQFPVANNQYNGNNGNNSPNGYPNSYPNNYPNGYSTPNQPNVIYVPVNPNEYFLGDSNKPFEVGQIIKLSNIYYDFDESYIRGDAQPELDRVYNLLTTFPSMRISLMSHTDSRGTQKYNQRLSKNRAKQARTYLIDKGIAKNRLMALGFGEEQLRNGCGNGVDCSEEEHQLNRRTEIRITQLNEPGVRVEYENNMPQKIDYKD